MKKDQLRKCSLELQFFGGNKAISTKKTKKPLQNF